MRGNAFLLFSGGHWGWLKHTCPITEDAITTNGLIQSSCIYRDSQQHKRSNYGIYRSSPNAFKRCNHSNSSYSYYSFLQGSEENFPLFSMVIRMLASNDIMNIQLTIVSGQCFMHDILRTMQKNNIKILKWKIIALWLITFYIVVVSTVSNCTAILSTHFKRSAIMFYIMSFISQI